MYVLLGVIVIIIEIFPQTSNNAEVQQSGARSYQIQPIGFAEADG